MEKPYIALDEPGKTVLALGNEAIARGAFEAGVKIGSGYPGTPSTEILENFNRIAVANPEIPIDLEWSINEKVGFEVGLAGSMCNARSLVTMKHVGLNVAADAFMTACYAGAQGGLVCITADDPSMHSSQNEQDNRYYGLHGLVPVVEPYNTQEAKDLMKYCFDFSEKFSTLVLYRTTTRINHARGNLKLGEITKINRVYKFTEEQRERWVHLPSGARLNKVKLLDRLEKITEFAEEFPFNSCNIVKGANLGIISAGVPYAHTIDAIKTLDLEDKVSIFKLGMVYPLPEKSMLEFLKSHDEVVIIEELEPVLESMIKKLAYENGLTTKIHGKDVFPRSFEFYPELIVEKIAGLTKLDSNLVINDPKKYLSAPKRAPVLCDGCGHRLIYQAVQRVEEKLGVRLPHTGDIGCYTLGYYPPLNGIDTCIAMGASTGIANGISKLDKRPILAMVGDSTFFHSGLSGLINAVYNENEFILIIFNNSSTSMTGHQEHPGTGLKISGEPGQKINIAKLIEGAGVSQKNIWQVKATKKAELDQAIEDAINAKGVRVIIAESICVLAIKKRRRRTKK